jgi:hypothetical protein
LNCTGSCKLEHSHLNTTCSSYISRRQKSLGEKQPADERLSTLYSCMRDIQSAGNDQRKKSAAQAAFIECDLVLKMHRQLQGEKLLPMLLERQDMDKIIEYSE